MDRLKSFHLWRGDRKSNGAASTSAEITQHPPPSPAHVVVDVSDSKAAGDLKTKYTPFVLSFEDLTYRVKEPKKNAIAAFLPRTAPADSPLPEAPTEKPRTKTLLASISGEAREGEILAVLGASGSGKSTLVDALANRISHESLRGTVALNGEPLEGRLLRAISAYVRQDDLLFPMLTVEETLMFAAEFRLPQSLPAEKKKARVQALIDQLGLRAAAGTIIGDEGNRGVSGGERRRVSIGIDIIHDPIILFLDEPTSGLDSTSAFSVVQVLKNIALSGSIVITTIHQPSFRILGLLDSLLFLSRGSIVYSGAPAGLQPYFTDFGHPIPENENRTEFTLDLIRELESSPTGTKPLVDFHASRQLKKSSTHLDKNNNNHVLPLMDAIAASISRGKLVSGATDLTDNGHPAEMKTFANPFWTELRVLAKRSFTNTRRQPDLFAFRLATVMITGFILATVYWNLDTTPKGVQERLGFFAFAMSVMFYTCGDALPVFLHERYIFMRETSYNAYRRSSYVLANAVASFPALVILSLAFVATTFFSVGLAGGFDGFLFFFLIVLTSFWTGNSFVTFLSGVVSSVMVGFTVVIAVLAYYLLVSGFFITRDRIPSYWMWFHYLSLVKYPYEAVLHNEFDDASRCFVRGVQIFDNSPLGGATEAVKLALLKGMGSTLGTNITTSTCFVTGPDVLAQQGISSMSKWNCLLITLAWGFLFRALFYVALMLGGRNKRR